MNSQTNTQPLNQGAPRRRRIIGAAVATIVAATLVGQSFLAPQLQAETPAAPQVDAQTLERVEALSQAMKQVGKLVEPSVVSIEIEKRASAGGRRGQIDEDLLKRFFPDNDGDGEPDVPPGFRFRFGPGGGQDAPDGEGDGEAGETPGNRRSVRGEGSGVIVDVNGDKAFIVTNNHVAADATKLVVTLSDGRKIEDVRVVGTDPRSDLAVLEITGDGLVGAKWGDSETLAKGDIVMAFGSPFGYVGSMTQGIVSGMNRSTNPSGGFGLLGRSGYEYFIQTDCAINPGNSGGPLVNTRGEIVGINTAIASNTGSFNGIGFAIPSEMVKFVYNQIKTTGKVTRGWLGVEISDVTVQPKRVQATGYKANTGAFVGGVLNGTPAAGKLRPDDVIVSLDGEPIATSRDLRLRIATTEPGKEVNFGVVRGGKQQTVTVKLGTLPDPEQTAVAGAGKKDQANTSELGATLSDAIPARLKSVGLPENAKGALVTGVKAGSAAQMAGLNTGDLITRIGDKDVTNAAEAAEALKNAKLADGINLIIENREGTKSIFIQVEGK